MTDDTIRTDQFVFTFRPIDLNETPDVVEPLGIELAHVVQQRPTGSDGEHARPIVVGALWNGNDAPPEGELFIPEAGYDALF